MTLSAIALLAGLAGLATPDAAAPAADSIVAPPARPRPVAAAPT